MQLQDIPKFNDIWWDIAEPKEREKLRLEHYKQVILFAKEHVPFYKVMYQGINPKKIAQISSFDSLLKTIPILTKDHIVFNIENPEIFLPDIPLDEFIPNRGEYFEYGTGGTTSEPILVKYSMQDWRAASITANRHIEYDFYNDPYYIQKFGHQDDKILNTELKNRNTPLNNKRIGGVYNADHITNNIYATMLTNLGMKFHWRPSTKQDISEVYKHLRKHKVNGILAPPEDLSEKQTKGITLDHLLEFDSKTSNQNDWSMNARYNPDFQFLFWSSLPLSKELYEHLVFNRKISYIKGNFGSTEIAPTGATCSRHPLDFHLTHGYSDLLVGDLNTTKRAKPNTLGYTISSKLAGTNIDGIPVFPSGSFFLLYMTGDGGKLTEEFDCGCGRNTARLYGLKRLNFHRGKQTHSCHLG